MIFGSYPCCNAPLSIAMTERAGFIRELCPHCGFPVWHHMSRLDPESWTEEEFLKEYRVNEVTKQVEEIAAAPELTPAQKEALLAMMNKLLLYGDFTIEVPRGLVRGLSPIESLRRLVE